MRRALSALAAAALMAGLLSACAVQEPVDAPQGPAVEAPEVPDVPDCDAEDKRKNEVPDCGFTYGGRFYAWSWVKAGKKTPPYGWRADREKSSVIAPPAPKKPVAVPTARATQPPPAAVPVPPRQTATRKSTPTRRTTTRTVTRRR
jgi:hypothetical protein